MEKIRSTGCLASRLVVMVVLAGAANGCTEVDADRAPFLVVAKTWPGSPVPLEGVELCETDTNNCELTDASGEATVYVPAGQEISVTVEKEGYQPELYPLIVPIYGATFQASLVPRQRQETAFAYLESPYPMVDTGMILIVVAPNPQCEGVTLAAFGAPGNGRVFYIDDDETASWNPLLTATSTTGIGGVIELAPAEYRIEIGGSADDCVLLTGWASPTPNSVILPVKAGFLSEAHVACDCS